MTRPKSLIEAAEEFRKALDEFVLLLAEEWGIIKIMDWLEDKLRRFNK